MPSVARMYIPLPRVHQFLKIPDVFSPGINHIFFISIKLWKKNQLVKFKLPGQFIVEKLHLQEFEEQIYYTNLHLFCLDRWPLRVNFSPELIGCKMGCLNIGSENQRSFLKTELSLATLPEFRQVYTVYTVYTLPSLAVLSRQEIDLA